MSFSKMRFLFFLSGLLTQTAYANGLQSNPLQIYCQALGTSCGTGRSFLIDLASTVEALIVTLIGGAAVLAVIYGGILIITSSLDESKRETGKKVIEVALIGLVFALLAHSVVIFVGNFFALA